MIKLQHFSASTFTAYGECPPRWAGRYDGDKRVTDRNDASDAGNLVHGALERWRDPQGEYPQTIEGLRQAFFDSCREQQLAESFPVFKRGLELIERAYKLTLSHPSIPMHMAQTIAVEYPLHDPDDPDAPWHPVWSPYPIRGMIDNLFTITPDPDKPKRIVLGVEDYKTGRAKTFTDLTTEDPQAPLYVKFAREVIVPFLEAQGYEVIQVAAIWTYINDGTAVLMLESDLDLDSFAIWVNSIGRQILDFVAANNELEAKFAKQIENANILASDGYLEEANAVLQEFDRAVDDFFEKYERVNHYCSYCQRKNRCRSFQRAIRLEGAIDLMDPNLTMEALWKRRSEFAAMAKEGEEQRKNIDEYLRTYVDQERVESIPVAAIGKEIYIQERTNRSYSIPAVVEKLGVEFIIENAEITQKAVSKKVAEIEATVGKDRAREIVEYLDARMTALPGARIVAARNIKPPATNGKKK